MVSTYPVRTGMILILTHSRLLRFRFVVTSYKLLLLPLVVWPHPRVGLRYCFLPQSRKRCRGRLSVDAGLVYHRRQHRDGRSKQAEDGLSQRFIHKLFLTVTGGLPYPLLREKTPHEDLMYIKG